MFSYSVINYQKYLHYFAIPRPFRNVMKRVCQGRTSFNAIMLKEEPELVFAATERGGGEGDAGGDFIRIIGIDECYDPPKQEPELELELIGGDGSANEDYGSAKEEPESKFNIVYHPVKEEPEPALAATDDEAVADDVRDVGYACPHCGIGLSTREFKVKHELRCRVRMQRREFESQITKLYHCGYCRCPFVNEEFKEQHQRRHCLKRPVAKKRRSRGTNFECDKCKYVAKRRQHLEAHFLTHNKNNAVWFTCTQCSFKTVQKSTMTRHTKIHDNTFSYCCPVCGKSFRTKLSLDHHLLGKHSDELDEVSELITSKIYTCDVCDQFTTVFKTNLNNHLTFTHLKGVGRQKYECPRCPYSTFTKGSLTKHLKRHAEQKDYRCTVCKKQFTGKQELDSHILYNHADNVDLVKTITSQIHRCVSCSFTTVHKTNLKRHVRLKHI